MVCLPLVAEASGNPHEALHLHIRPRNPSDDRKRAFAPETTKGAGQDLGAVRVVPNLPIALNRFAFFFRAVRVCRSWDPGRLGRLADDSRALLQRAGDVLRGGECRFACRGTSRGSPSGRRPRQPGRLPPPALRGLSLAGERAALRRHLEWQGRNQDGWKRLYTDKHRQAE